MPELHPQETADGQDLVIGEGTLIHGETEELEGARLVGCDT
jgi:hypothetical protein